MTPERAAIELQDSIMVGTMMLASTRRPGWYRAPSTARPTRSGRRSRSSRRCRLQPGVERLFHVPAGAGAGVRRLRRCPETRRRPNWPTSPSRAPTRPLRSGIPAGWRCCRTRPVERHRGGRGKGEGGDAPRQGAPPRPRARRTAAVRRGRDAGRRQVEGARSAVAGKATVLIFPDLNTGKRDLQGRPAVGQRREHGADAPGSGQTGQ